MPTPSPIPDPLSLLDSLLAAVKDHHKVMVQRIEALKNYLVQNQCEGVHPPTTSQALVAHSYASSKGVAKEEFNENDFDVILYPTALKVKYRGYPEQKSPLIEEHLKGLGPITLPLFAWLLRHPSRVLTCQMVPGIVGNHNGYCQRGSLAHSVKKIRDFLGGQGLSNPYIRTVPAYETGRGSGGGYVLREEYRYVVI